MQCSAPEKHYNQRMTEVGKDSDMDAWEEKF